MLPNVLEVEGVRYCIYGDSSYNPGWFMEVPFQGASFTPPRRAFNKSMSVVRITVEWIFKEIKMQFATMDIKRKMKIREAPVGLLYLSSMLLSHFRNCLYPNQISRFINCAPASLKEYVTHK